MKPKTYVVDITETWQRPEGRGRVKGILEAPDAVPPPPKAMA